MRLGHYITQKTSAHEKPEAPRETTGMESQQNPQDGQQGASAGSSPGRGSRREERREEAVQTVQRTDGSGSMSQALAIPEINREYLERGKAVSQAGGGLCQHNLYFQAGDI